MIHAISIILCMIQLILLPWIDLEQTEQKIDCWSNNWYFYFIDTWLLVYEYERLFMLIFRISNYTWKYRSLYLWLTLNIRSQKSLVKFWFYGIEVSLNPIEVKVKPTFIVNKFSFIFIHIPWFRRFTFCILNCLASDIL